MDFSNFIVKMQSKQMLIRENTNTQLALWALIFYLSQFWSKAKISPTDLKTKLNIFRFWSLKVLNLDVGTAILPTWIQNT